MAPLFPPIAMLGLGATWLFFFLYWRLATSKCPRCSRNFYSLTNIFTSGVYYTKSGLWAVQCQWCSLQLSELPEVDEVKIETTKDE